MLELNENSAKDVKRIAIGLLSRREHSVAELRRKLSDKSFALSVIDEVLPQLAAEGWQSDRRFAEVYVRMRAAKGYGPICITQELRERGIDSDLLTDVLDERDESWFISAKLVQQKKFPETDEETFAAIAKQKRFLQYRGFTSEQIKAVV